MSDTIFKGKVINSEFLKKIEDIVSQLSVSDEMASPDNTIETEFENSEHEKIRVYESDKEKADLLWELNGTLSEVEGKSNELFQIPLVQIPTNIASFTDPTQATVYVKKTIYITKAKAKILASKKEEYETKLGIKFPEELYQLARSVDKTDTIPDHDFSAPPLRKYNQTATEYEKELYDYYKENKYQITYDDNNKRKPLPHEKVRYSTEGEPENFKEGEGPRESYGTHLVELEKEKFIAKKIITEKGTPGLGSGRKKITGTRTAGEKLSETLSTINGILKPNRTLKIALLAALVIYCVSIGVLPALSIAPGLFLGKTALTTVTAGLLICGIKAFKDRKLIAELIKLKIKELRGKKGKKTKVGEDGTDDEIELPTDEETQILEGSNTGLFDAVKVDIERLIKTKAEIEMYELKIERLEKLLNNPANTLAPEIRDQEEDNLKLAKKALAAAYKNLRADAKRVHTLLGEYDEFIIPPEPEEAARTL